MGLSYFERRKGWPTRGAHVGWLRNCTPRLCPFQMSASLAVTRLPRVLVRVKLCGVPATNLLSCTQKPQLQCEGGGGGEEVEWAQPGPCVLACQLAVLRPRHTHGQVAGNVQQATGAHSDSFRGRPSRWTAAMGSAELARKMACHQVLRSLSLGSSCSGGNVEGGHLVTCELHSRLSISLRQQDGGPLQRRAAKHSPDQKCGVARPHAPVCCL